MADLTLSSTFEELIKKVNENGSGGGSSTGGNTIVGDCNLLIARNEAELLALTVDENDGKVIIYVGADTANYTQGAFYLVNSANSQLGKFILGKSRLS